MSRVGRNALSLWQGRLWLRVSRRRGPRLRFESSGVVVVDRRCERLFEWSSHRVNATAEVWWRSIGFPGTRYNRPSVILRHEDHRAGPFAFGREHEWSVPAPWLSLSYPWALVTALIDYLAATPDARSGLTDPNALERLLADLASAPTYAGWPPEPALMGNKFDVDRVIESVLKQVGVRRFDGRPVRGEPVPALAELTTAVRAGLPPWTAKAVADQLIEERLQRVLGVRPWPFDHLTRDV